MKILKIVTFIILFLQGVILVFTLVPDSDSKPRQELQGLGIEYKRTKYNVGDKFKTRDPVPKIFTLKEWTPVRKHEQIKVDIYRWKTEIEYMGKVTEAWTDDVWLDELKQLETYYPDTTTKHKRREVDGAYNFFVDTSDVVVSNYQ